MSRRINSKKEQEAGEMKKKSSFFFFISLVFITFAPQNLL